ncbi:MAG: InlB B-repeat-containing protein [Synergistaceae bacterium]|nr:InlB B-repeat-containing protein [Synergistaceae bacterium]
MFTLIFLAFVSGGCGGGGGSSTPVSNNENGNDNNNTPDEQEQNVPNPPVNTNFIVTFDSNGGSDVSLQEVQNGSTANMPEIPEKENNLFVGWYLAGENNFSFKFNFDTPISRDITLHAKWYDQTDLTDTDGDGLTDALEFAFGTDPLEIDTDDDGLTDYDELNWLNYNPLAKDSDGNGVADGDEDKDGDGLTNIQEGNFGTNMILTDTDMDGLTDYEEVITYKTDPLKPDTDDDGVDDGTEVAIGSNPLVAETKFTTSLETSRTAEDPEAIDVSVSMDSSAENAGTLYVQAVELVGHPLISSAMPGYISNAAYEITAENSADIESATLTFTLGSKYSETDSFKPRIYYVNEEAGVFEKVENQNVSGNKISATLTHFSTYILLNSVMFDEIWSNDIRPIFTNASNDNARLDIVFVIDYSASMQDNDPNRLAVKLPQNFVD